MPPSYGTGQPSEPARQPRQPPVRVDPSGSQPRQPPVRIHPDAQPPAYQQPSQPGVGQPGPGQGQTNLRPSAGRQPGVDSTLQGDFGLSDEKVPSGSQQKRLNRALAREERWKNNRLAVPYHTDGPKITFGVIWFAMLLGSGVLGVSTSNSAVGSLGIVIVCAPIAGLAALQTTHAWFPKLSAPRLWMAAAAYLIALSGFFGLPGVIIGFAFGVLMVTLYVLLYRGHQRPPLELFDVLARSAIPAGLAVASMAAIAKADVSGLISLILLVSAYEAGDFLVGTGSSSAVEGPLAGLVALGTVAFLLFLTLPPPFTESTVLLFALITAISCPLGQIVASALLPRGAAWAPALRRLDSYLIAAPLWMVLLDQLPQIS